MAAAEKFCLRWNDFESNISVAFRELREEKDFFDVTLACEDSQVSAHKVILSACSPFFRNVLRKNLHQHPLLYLKGVKYQEMLSVLNFMYQGEVNVAQEELNSFLAVAEDLRVKGLTQNTQEKSKSRSPPPRDAFPPPKRPRPALPTPAQTRTPQQVYRPHDEREEEVQEVQEVQTVKQEQQSYQENQESAVALEDTYQDDYGDYGQYEGQYEGIDPNTGLPLADGNKGEEQEQLFKELDRVVQSKCVKINGAFSCADCNFQTRHQTNLKNHIETHHMMYEVKIPCLYCETSCPTRSAMRAHVKRQHSFNTFE